MKALKSWFSRLSRSPPSRRRRSTGRSRGQGKGACPAASVALADKLRPLAKGEVAALAVAKTPKLATPVAFAGPDGQKLSLADFKGRAVLLEPMGDLVRALPRGNAGARQAAGRGRRAEIRGGDRQRRHRAGGAGGKIPRRDRRLASHSATPTIAATRSRRCALAGKALGLPTSLLIDAEGCEIGVVAGPANWTSPDALAAVKALEGG